MLSMVNSANCHPLIWPARLQCGHMVEQEVMRGQLKECETKAPSCERESRFAQVKRMLAGTLHTTISTNHSTVLCATAVANESTVQCNVTNHTQPTVEENKEEVKPRKRKERHESIGSITQERKVVS